MSYRQSQMPFIPPDLHLESKCISFGISNERIQKTEYIEPHFRFRFKEKYHLLLTIREHRKPLT